MEGREAEDFVCSKHKQCAPPQHDQKLKIRLKMNLLSDLQELCETTTKHVQDLGKEILCLESIVSKKRNDLETSDCTG